MVKRIVNLNYDVKPSFHHQFNANLLKPYLSQDEGLLDIGCWTGQLIALLKNNCRIVGIDISEKPLKTARQLYPGAKFIKASVLNLPFPNGSFSTVAFNDVIEHLPAGSEEKALKEIKRVLKPQGKVLLTTMLDHPLSKLFDPAWVLGHRHYSEKYLTDLLGNSGFRVMRIYKTGGFTRALSYLVELAYKHILGKKFLPPRKLEELIQKEYISGKGFYEIHIFAQAN